MRMSVAAIAAALGVMGAPADAQPAPRRVIVVAEPGDPRAAEQHAALARDAAGLRERDVVVQDATPESAQRSQPGLNIPAQARFNVLLVGRDGGVKLRRDHPVNASEINALIDTMPMRRAEMRAARR